MPDDIPASAPDPRSFRSVFRVYEVHREGDAVRYHGDPLTPRDEVVDALAPAFREAGYEVDLGYDAGEFVLVARPRGLRDGVPWTNVALFGLTILTTLYAGTGWYYVRDVFSPALVRALPFAAAVLAVLGTHELGHYLASRYYDVDATLPYFIPMLPPFGTMGAVIRMRGQIPDRKALFDIGVAGPLAGLVMAVAVTAVGLTLPPVHVPDWVFQGPTIEIQFQYPLLMRAVAAVLGESLTPGGPRTVVNPVVFAGWIGMLVTVLNLLPVGQLDGGHLVRAVVGPRQETVAAVVPGALFALAAYLYFVRGVSNGAGIWAVWGVLTAVFAYVGPARPLDDATPLDRRRVALAVVTFVLGALCFTPVPVTVG